ncbi:hypothetical protein J3R83DRAFT_4174 [Lanmaoa asiatica]|nr:hypothetical protein J3R83DRAFT_4174 [Lanmaoa asiatica]
MQEYRPAKRRRVAGLNTRFDRMIKSVNTMLSYRNNSPASSRKRIQSSSTSSVSSHDVPKTPVDAYSSLHPGKLGKDFSVLKMKKLRLLPREDSDGCTRPVAPPKEPRSPLPDWLANTFCSLEAGHPLRGLLSPSRINSPPAQLLGVSHEEELFAFSPFDFDKQEEVPDAAYRADSISNVQEHVSSIVPTEPTLSHLHPEASTNVLPFSTPGSFAPARRSIESPIVHVTFKRPLVQVPQQVTSHATNTMHPVAMPVSHLRPDELPQCSRAFSNLVQDTESPSDFQDHGACISHNYQDFRGGDDNLNVYATPAPTFTCSLPVYFDSPTEDPSLSDPLQPESYELDLNSIDFRWRPFLRSNAQESDTNKHSVSRSSPRYAVPNQVGDQSGCNACFRVDQGEHGASSEELGEDVEIAYLDGVGAIPPSNMNTSPISNLIRPWPSLINDAQHVRPAFALAPGVFLSPLRDRPESASLTAYGVPPRGDGENIHTSEELPLLHGGEMKAIESEAHKIRPSTPIRQVPVSPPSAPQKVRSSQLSGMPRAPVRKTSSALSWMIPLKPSKRTIAVHDDVNCHPSRVFANSHDSIESWSEMG